MYLHMNTGYMFMVKALKTTLRRMVLQLSPEGTWDLRVLSEKDHRGCSEEAELEG